jgi:predicted Fe-Mo cluster-binding NifX family protein
MKICISSQGDNLDAQVDPRFGRCAYFIFYDTDKNEFEVIQNTNVMASSGAGIQSAQLVLSKGAQVVITGNVGPNAFGIFNSAGISVIAGVAGISVKEAIEKFKRGELKNTASNPTVPGHFGIGGAFPSPPGRGKGFWGLGGSGGGFQPPFSGQPRMDKTQELEFLKQQVEFLKQQMEMINKRIQELEKE